MSERHQDIETSVHDPRYRLRPADARRLMTWARRSSRSYPWRHENDPYRLAVTELMLVRTRAEQVARVWAGFFEKFPTLAALTGADPAEVETVLRPLGLRWRTQRIVAFSRAASSRPDWLAVPGDLPGAGPYVLAAARLGSVGFGTLPVDVTIARVLARFFGIQMSGEARRNAEVLLAAASMGRQSRASFHAWLDLAALVCTPRNPACVQCPLRSACRSVESPAVTQGPD